MIIELLGAKIIAPFYGASLYVWSSVLGVTLVSLAAGYYLGGYISQKYKTLFPMYLILPIGAFFVVVAPNFAPTLMEATSNMGVRAGSLVSVLLYLSPSVVCMGMVSPIIIGFVNQNTNQAGKSAGTVYAVSTVGGIIGTFLAGFYLIPVIGIKLTALITASLLITALVLLLLIKKEIPKAIISLAAFVIFSTYFFLVEPTTPNSDTKIRYQSSGVLGQWTVVDIVANVHKGEKIYTRQLLLNGVDQTYTPVGQEPVSVWYYPHKLSALAGIKPTGSKVLLLGMGGGSIAHNLILLGFDVDIVELDRRVPEIAEKWFGYDPSSANLVIDDARHYIKNTKKKYDLIIMDLVSGEVQPSHVFTQEGLTEMKQVLEDDALVIVNFQGRLDKDNLSVSRAPRSVYKTFTSVGYNMLIGKQREQETTSLSDDLLMYGSPGNLDFDMAFKDTLRYNAIFSIYNLAKRTIHLS
jgi:predicted membrane-bound spermidine synthase